MLGCRQRMVAACKLEDAFEYVADWNNFSNFFPVFVAMKPTSLVQYGLGTSLDCTMVLGKVELMSTLDYVEFFKNKRIVVKSSRGIRSRSIWEFKDVGGKILITFEFEYDLPINLALRAEENVSMQKSIETAACKSMELLKWTLESMPPSKDED
jgi:hypothetical protein